MHGFAHVVYVLVHSPFLTVISLLLCSVSQSVELRIPIYVRPDRLESPVCDSCRSVVLKEPSRLRRKLVPFEGFLIKESSKAFQNSQENQVIFNALPEDSQKHARSCGQD